MWINVCCSLTKETALKLNSTNGTDFFKIRFPEIKPSDHNAKDLFAALIALQDAINIIALKENSDVHEDHLYWSLTEITHSSTVLKFDSNQEIYTESANKAFTAIKNNDFSDTPEQASAKIVDFHKYVKSKKANCEIYIGDSLYHTLSYETDLDVPIAFKTSGETVLYGELIRVGGAEPVARVKILGGKTISCPISKDKAQEIGIYLYKDLKLTGRATWNSSKEIVRFTIKDFEIFAPNNIVDVLSEARELGLSKWDDIDDIEGYLNGEDED